MPPTSTLDNYFNSGLVVLRSYLKLFDGMSVNLAATSDLSRYLFSEQDFLSAQFAERWLVLPYGYNALKILRYHHRGLRQFDEIKNVHYILEKPWNRDLTQATSEHDRYLEFDKLW